MEIYRRSHLALAITLAITAFVVSVVIAKTELIINGTFDSNVNNWSDFSTGGSISHSSTEGHTATGAANVQNAYTGSGAWSSGGAQCINLPTPVADYYTVEGWTKVPSQLNTSAQGYIRFQFYSNLDCSAAVGTERDTGLVDAGSDWTRVSKTGSTPVGAQSVQVRLYVKKSGADSAYAYFDDISFFPSNATAITLSSLTARGEQPAAQPERALTTFSRWLVAALVGAALVAVGASITALRRRQTFIRSWKLRAKEGQAPSGG